MKNMFYWLLHTRLIHMYWLNSLANNNLQESANKIKNRVSHTFFIHVQYTGHDTLSHNKDKMFSYCGYTSPYVCLLKPPFINCICYMYDGINLIALNSSSLSSPCFCEGVDPLWPWCFLFTLTLINEPKVNLVFFCQLLLCCYTASFSVDLPGSLLIFSCHTIIWSYLSYTGFWHVHFC